MHCYWNNFKFYSTLSLKGVVLRLEEEIALVEEIQKYDDEESQLILWEEYGNFGYKSFLKYIYY